MLVFKLLEQGRLALATLPAYLDSVPVYRQYNRSYFGLPPATLAEQLVGELERAGAVTRNQDYLIPA